MRKIIILFIGFLSIFCLWFCSSDEPHVSNSDQVETINFTDSKLIQELSSINENLLADCIETRGLTTKQFLNIAVADIGGAWTGGKGGAAIGGKVGLCLGSPITGAAFGAFLGAAICGAGSSWLATPDTRAFNTQNLNYTTISQICDQTIDGNLSINNNNIQTTPIAEEKIELDDKILSTVTLEQKVLNVGKMHNVILSVLDGSIIIKETESSSSKDSLYNNIMSSNEMSNLFDEMKENVSNNTFYSADSKADYALKLFEDLFSKYCENNMDVVYIVNQYSDVIKKSTELTDEEKECILLGLSTALYSFNYWNVTLEQ